MFAPPSHEQHVSSGPGGSFATAAEARNWLISEADSWFAAYKSTALEGRHDEVIAATARIWHFGDLWHAWGHWNEFFALAASAAAAAGDAEAETMAVLNLAHMHQHETFDFEAALSAGRRALQIAHTSEDAGYIA
jgi:hypothetical protein